MNENVNLALHDVPESSTAHSIRLLLPSDIPAAMGLSRDAGWNQLPDDWERLLALEPTGCFALECEGQLAATTTIIRYGTELAWIGMVLTNSRFRRRGFAGLLLQRALNFAEKSGIAWVKLDATESGINLYRKHGFVEECEVQRWQRPAGHTAGSEVLSCSPDLIYACDKFGADRTELLKRLAKLGAVSLPGEGYAMGRRGSLAAYFGPCVANSSAAARRLLRWFLDRHHEETISWDLFPANQEAVCIAQEFGFVPVRRLVRMARAFSSSTPIANHPSVFAIAGFELG